MMNIKAISLLSSYLIPTLTYAHSRLECPPPRSGKTGEKTGPCDAPDDLTLAPYPLIPNAFNTITWLESIPHPGAPGRLALSRDGDDSTDSFESCILLDHIPHDENSRPNYGDASSWHRSSITVFIPDVKCERCHLQFITVMSDEGHGVPVDTSCVYAGALSTGNVDDDSLPSCPAVYHSCSPVSIDGSVPRNDIDTCDTDMFEEKLNWPMKPAIDMDLVEDGSKYARSTYFYKGDPGVYNLTDSRMEMTGYPIKDCPSMQFCDPAVYFRMSNMVPEDASYRAMEGTCSAMVTMEVEPFVLGQLPSTPKDMSAEVEADPCAICEQMKPCYTDGCVLRDAVSGNWSGLASECNTGAAFCEQCFAESACYGYGPFGSVEEDTTEEKDDNADVNEPVEDTTPGADMSAGSVEEETTEEKDDNANADESVEDTAPYALNVSDPSTDDEEDIAATEEDVNSASFRMQPAAAACFILFWNAALFL